MEDALAIRNLRATAISVAIEEMRAETSCESPRRRQEENRRRLYATVWLGSREAGKWLRILGDRGNHVTVLRAIKWSQYAQQVLDSGSRLNEKQRNLLEKGIEALRG